MFKNYLKVNNIGLLIWSLVLISLFNCKPSSDRNGNYKNTDNLYVNSTKTEVSDSSYEDDSTTTVNYFFPSPIEIIEEILDTNIGYNKQYTNPSKNAINYIEGKQKALNLGVYLSDLAYTNLFGDRYTALEYLQTIRIIARQLNVYDVLDNNLYDRVKNNLTQKDSIINIISEMYGDIREILESTNRNNVYALIESGAIIEALYISAMSAQNMKEYKTIANKIFEQKYLLNNLYLFAKQYKDDSNVNEILKVLEDYLSIMGQAKSNTSPIKVINKNGRNLIRGGEEVIVTEENFRLLKENIIETRQDICEI